MVPPTIALRDFADPHTQMSKTREQAQKLMRAIDSQPQRWVELDCSGISGISREFMAEFFRALQQECPTFWLVPRHYDQTLATFIAPLLSHLQQLREQAWIDGCERFATGTGLEAAPTVKNQAAAG